MNKTLLCSLALTAFASVAHAQLQMWTVGSFLANSVSGDGGTVAGYGSSNMIWRNGTGFTSIGGSSSGSLRLSRDGNKVAGSYQTTDPYTGNNYTQMAVYDVNAASWTAYGNLGYHSGSTASTGYNISGDGTTVVGQSYYNTTATGGTAARVNAVWSNTPGTVNNLNAQTINNGRAQAVNYDGTVIGGYAQGTAPGSIWINGAQTNMTHDFGSGAVSLAAVEDISSNGRWVAGDGNSATGGAAYLYDTVNGTYKFAPTPFSANNEIAVVGGVSDNGRFVAGRYLKSGLNPYINGHAFIWDTVSGDFYNLDDVVDANGFDRQGIHYSTITGISDDGMTLVGFGGSLTTVDTRSFYVHLDSVPEPATLTLLAFPALALLRKKRKA